VATKSAPRSVATASRLSRLLHPKAVSPTPEDMEAAKNDALLQLKIGRTAHHYTVIISIALLADGFLALYLIPNIGSLTTPKNAGLLTLFIPLAGGLALAFLALSLKWSAWRLWPWELHFALTVGAVIADVGIAYLWFASLFNYGPTGGWNLIPWFFAVTLVAIGLPLVALAMTWSGWPRRKIISVVSAVAPIGLAFLLYLPPGNAQSTATALAATLFVSAALYQTAGSFLHLIASGTSVHEREVTSVGQGRMVLVAQDLQNRTEALQFRETAVGKREVDSEYREANLMRQRAALEEAHRQLGAMEADVTERGQSLVKERETWAGEVAEAAALRRQAEDREANLKLREQEVARRLPLLTEREQGLIKRESESTRKELTLSQRETELKRHTDGLGELETRLAGTRQELERRAAEVIRKESDLKGRESLIGTSHTERGAATTRVAAISDRESKLQQLKLKIDEQTSDLSRKEKAVDLMLRDAKSRELQLQKRMDEIARREGELSLRETTVRPKIELADERQKHLDELLQQYEARMGEADRRTLDLSGRSEEIAQRQTSISGREKTLKERETQLGEERIALDRAQQDLIDRERLIAVRETEVSLRASGPHPTRSEMGLGASLAGTASASIAAIGISDGTATAHSATAKVPKGGSTGIARLDGLLKNGIGPHGQVLLAGPPFMGKEIVLYNFLVEGLRQGESIVILTATRTPSELSQELGVVLPQLKEYEQKGRVAWVDASTPAPTGSTSGNILTVKGPDDLAGILSALVKASNQIAPAAEQKWRLGFLGLSACLAHRDPPEGYRFFQNLVGILKPRACRAMYTVDAGTITDAQIETIQTRMDGMIRFKEDRGRTSLSVQGFGDVETRNWVEYRATNRTLLIGSFTLERIR